MCLNIGKWVNLTREQHLFVVREHREHRHWHVKNENFCDGSTWLKNWNSDCMLQYFLRCNSKFWSFIKYILKFIFTYLVLQHLDNNRYFNSAFLKLFSSLLYTICFGSSAFFQTAHIIVWSCLMHKTGTENVKILRRWGAKTSNLACFH